MIIKKFLFFIIFLCYDVFHATFPNLWSKFFLVLFFFCLQGPNRHGLVGQPFLMGLKISILSVALELPESCKGFCHIPRPMDRKIDFVIASHRALFRQPTPNEIRRFWAYVYRLNWAFVLSCLWTKMLI